MPIHKSLNSEEMNVALVEAALYLIFKKDFACLKKFSTWLLSHLDEDDEIINSEELTRDDSI